MMGFGQAPAVPTCSRAGCREPAKWNVNWRNPRIHPADRVKIWLGCDEHVFYLREYLETHDFPVMVTPLDEKVTIVPDRQGLER